MMKRGSYGRRSAAIGSAAGALLLAAASASSARADAAGLDDIGQELVGLEAEARKLSQGLQRPEELEQTHTPDEGERRMVSARLAFGMGEYDRAALLLYDVVENHADAAGYDTALYYLAESLFRKGHYVAARTYFTRLAEERGPESSRYRRAVQRLVELTLELDDDRDDDRDVSRWLSALDELPAEERRGAVPYVRGKHAYFSEDYETAIEHFRRVEPQSRHYAQAQYSTAASFVAIEQLPAAAEILRELVERPPKTEDDRRIIELSQMALARIHYERNEPTQAIDRYLEISRHSDRFDETLYEAAWVYVRNEQFDHALRALELLSLTDPTSAKLPEVRILEGNLRIRKAQRLTKAGKPGNSAEEYAKATEIFKTTKGAYEDAHDAIDEILREDRDPQRFIGQITGERSGPSALEERIPGVAVAWLRDEANVDTLVSIEDDLSEIENELNSADITAARLDSALGPENRANVFPELAEKRSGAIAAAERVVELRTTLATREQKLAARYGGRAEEVAELRRRRRSIEREIARLPDADLPYRERRERAQERYEQVDAEASEVHTVIQTAEAELTSLLTYLDKHGMPDADPSEVGEVRERIAELEGEIATLRDDLQELRKRATLARDRAGSERERKARELHTELRMALDAEHRALRELSAQMKPDDRVKAEQIASLHERANSILIELDDVTESVDAIVEVVLEDVRTQLDRERAHLAEYRDELSQYQDDSEELGAEALEDGLASVREEFEDILVRSDVGIVDVAWSRKEEADRTQRRLTLERARELRTLDAHFREVLEAQQARQVEETRREAEEQAAEGEAP